MWQEDIVCRASALDGLPGLIDSLGGNSEIFLREVGLKPEDLENRENFVPWLAYARLLRNASIQLGVRDFGLRWSATPDHNFNGAGPIAALAVIAPDVRTFLNTWVKYDKIHTNGSYTEFIEDSERATLRTVVHYSPAIQDTRQMKEACISHFHQIGRKYFLPPGMKPTRVGFPHRAISKPEIYEDYFDCPIEFNATSTYIEVPFAILEEKLGPDSETGRRIFESHTTMHLKKFRISQESFSAHVALILPNIMGLGKSDISHVAKALGMSVRKLQRLLKDEGVNYSEILADVRQNIAMQLLRDSDVSVSRIAALLDYTSDVPFCAAFNKWTNMSPRAYRNAPGGHC